MNSSLSVRPWAVLTVTSVFLFFFCLSGYFAQHAPAGFFTLIDDNSTMTFDTEEPAEQANAQSWEVDGVNQLYEQAFWYRVGNGPEESLHSLPVSAEGTSDVNFDGDDETLFVRYDGVGFNIEVLYTLDGGNPGSKASDLAEQISINSTSSSALDFHFFQYTDYDLEGSVTSDTGLFTNANAVRQSSPGARLTETVITPVPSHRELSEYSSIRDRLTDGLPTTLSDTPAIGTTIGPFDMTWAFQWDFSLPPNSTFQISKDKNLKAIPEPASLSLFGLCGLAMLVRRRR